MDAYNPAQYPERYPFVTVVEYDQYDKCGACLSGIQHTDDEHVAAVAAFDRQVTFEESN